MLDKFAKFEPNGSYDEAAIDYLEASTRYWPFCTSRTVELLQLRPGERILDVACGPGRSTTAAAQLVGEAGEAVGIDFSPRMLDIAAARAEQMGLSNVRFVEADFARLDVDKAGFDPESFDAVMCALGLFFVNDMPNAARSLFSLVRPGGRLIVTVFGHQVLEPMLTAFVELAGSLHSDLEVVLPWKRIPDLQTLSDVMTRAEIQDVQLFQETHSADFVPSDWWTAVMGSALRHTAILLGEDSTVVREDNERWAKLHSVTSLTSTVSFAVARKSWLRPA